MASVETKGRRHRGRRRSCFVALLVTAALPGCRPAAAPPRSAGSGGSGSTLLVLHKWSETLGAYDPDDGQRRGRPIPVGSIPHEMVLSGDGTTVFITNYGVKTYTDKEPGGNTISIVDLSRGAKIGEIALGRYRRPHGIEIGRSGRLYLTVDFPPGMLVVDPAAGRVVEAHDLDQVLPHMLAVTRDERTVYVANSGSGTITVLHPGAVPSTAQHIAVGGTPMGLALSSDDRRLYAATRDGQAVAVIDTAAGRVVGTIPLAGAPARVHVLPGDHGLLVTLIEAGDVALVEAASGRVLARVHAGARAEGVYLDPGGRFTIISVQAENKVVKLALPSLTKTLELTTDARPDPMLLVPVRLSFGGGS
jgi:YVTN family beta-propeller protein